MWRILILFLLMSSQTVWAAPQLDSEGFTSATVCGTCHVAIFDGWKNSMHANAVRDPIFLPIFREASERTGGESDRLCLSCHAPTTGVTQDWSLEDPITMEGVTCDFCHRVKDIKPNSSKPFQLDSGEKKWGPLKPTTSSPTHESSHSEIYEQSSFCGPCHEYVNDRGVVVLGTYSEWKKSPQAKKGQTCQTCHMPRVKGDVVKGKGKKSRESYINAHDATGGHSVDTIKKAVIIKIDEIKRSGEKVHVVIELENVGSGHMVPTGMPTRKLVLKVEGKMNGAVLFTGEREFQKVLLARNGKVIKKDADVFLSAYKVKQDNRLEPGKVRTEHFSFYAPVGKAVEIEASLHYVYQPRLIEDIEMKFELGRKRQRVPLQ